MNRARRRGDEAFGAINNIIFRLLSTTPPGKLTFTIFDPVGLGQNFAALTHLADYDESSINSRIWTQSAQFEEKLAELNEHMEKIIQMYLRNEYATIADYNAQAGSVAEKYHFLVIASFPVNFTETAAKRLRNIAANGARCGVFTLIHWDQRNVRCRRILCRTKCAKTASVSCAESGFELELLPASCRRHSTVRQRDAARWNPPGLNCCSMRRRRRILPRNFCSASAS